MTEGSFATGASQPLHQLNPLIQLYWRQFDEYWVLFEALSGQTHQMSSVTAAVLMCYEASPPRSTAALLAALVSDFGIAVDVTQAAQVLAVVDQLAALGLIVPVNDHVAV
ncbi:MAG: HPr-rel-A system PqqD family peptide chaperone [Polaromonas sp.]